MNDFIIKINNLRKSFNDIIAVNNISLNVKKGEMFGLVGPDGAGKTTTIRMLCGIIPPDNGEGEILGYDFIKNFDQIKKDIGYLSQRFSLYGDLSVDENIEFFAEIHQVTNYKQKRNELLEFTRLSPFRKRLASQLSGGMKQKLALACTLIHTPKIIFLDEPTTGVDPVSRRDFWKILMTLLKDGITIFMSTPYLDEAERCSTICLINKGNILISDNLTNIKSIIKNDIIELVCDDIRNIHKFLLNSQLINESQIFGDRINIILNENYSINDLINLLNQNKIIYKDIRKIVPSLENVFISLLKK